jgi:hypothetical protein
MLSNRRLRVAVLLASSALVVGVAAALAPFAHASTGLTASFVVTDDWGTGYGATYTIRNSGTSSVTGWKLEFDLPSTTTVRSFWTAAMTRSGTHWVFTNPNIERSLTGTSILLRSRTAGWLAASRVAGHVRARPFIRARSNEWSANP